MKPPTWVDHVIQEARTIASRPVEELSRLQQTLRYMLDLARYSAHSLRQHNAAQMAAALTYRTIFSLVPMLVLALVVFRAFVDAGEAEGFVQQQIYSFIDIGSVDIETEIQIDEQIREFTQKAYNIKMGGVGVVGLIVLIWAALAQAVTVEQCFNRIYSAPSGRPWVHRIMLYWSVITLGPVLLTVSLLWAGKLVELAARLAVVGSAVEFFGQFTALASMWLLLFLLYTLMPNTKVRLRSALIGSIVAAILWELGKRGFGLYLHYAVGESAAQHGIYVQVYGSLGLIPLFLLWLYLNWLVVLFGLEITYTMQTLPDFRQRQTQAAMEAAMRGDPLWVLPMMVHIGEAFARGQVIGRQLLAQQLGLPVRAVAALAEQLEAEGLINMAQSRRLGETGYSLAVPPERIPITRLLDVAAQVSNPQGKPRHDAGWDYLASLAQAQREAAGEATLATVLAKKG